jgi:hypothetical protein
MKFPSKTAFYATQPDLATLAEVFTPFWLTAGGYPANNEGAGEEAANCQLRHLNHENSVHPLRRRILH